MFSRVGFVLFGLGALVAAIGCGGPPPSGPAPIERTVPPDPTAYEPQPTPDAAPASDELDWYRVFDSLVLHHKDIMLGTPYDVTEWTLAFNSLDLDTDYDDWDLADIIGGDDWSPQESPDVDDGTEDTVEPPSVDDTAAADSGKPESVKTDVDRQVANPTGPGRLWFDLKKNMVQGETEVVTAIIYRGLIASEADSSPTEEITVADYISVTLKDGDAFRIDPVSEESLKSLQVGGFRMWQWSVTPQESDSQWLILVINIPKDPDAGTQVSWFDKTIRERVYVKGNDPSWLERQWEKHGSALLGVLLAGLLTGLVTVIGWFVKPRIQARIKDAQARRSAK